VPLSAESLVVAVPAGADLPDSDSSPDSEWAATKAAEMEWEEFQNDLMDGLLTSIALVDAAAEAKAAAEAAEKIVEFDGVIYMKAW
jgi:hypothetical protein